MLGCTLLLKRASGVIFQGSDVCQLIVKVQLQVLRWSKAFRGAASASPLVSVSTSGTRESSSDVVRNTDQRLLGILLNWWPQLLTILTR